MKIRQGFVSNSSSSSFAILGVKTSLKAIDPETFKKKVQYLVRPDENFEGGEGETFFYLNDKKSLDYVIEHGHAEAVYEIIQEFSDGESDLKPFDFPKGKKVVVLTGTMDQGSPYDFDSLREAYQYSGVLDDEDADEPTITDTNHLRMECTVGSAYKFYEMTKNPTRGTFTVTYGRIGNTGKQETYNISEWDSKILEKTKKGYVIK